MKKIAQLQMHFSIRNFAKFSGMISKKGIFIFHQLDASAN